MPDHILAAPGASPKEIVFGLLQQCRYDCALAEALTLPATHPDRDSLERVVCARMGRFAEAAAAGRRHLARSSATAEDYFRQAQILLRCGLAREAFAAGMTALRAAPEDWRMLGPVVEAVLAEPELEAALRAEAAPIIAKHPRVPPPPREESRGVLLANRLPHFAPLGGDHPLYQRYCNLLAPIPRYRPESYGTGLLAAAIEELPRAIFAVERLISAGIGVGRRAAARYVGSRAASLLTDDGGCTVEIVLQTSMTLGERPYFIYFDFLPMLFYPFSPAEQMSYPEDDEEIYRIVGHELDAPACLGFLTYCEEQASLLSMAFDNPRLGQKSHHINLISSIEEAASPRQFLPRGEAATITLLFTSSFTRSEDGFFMRGGVDVVNAFLELHQEFDHLRLNLCGQLPRSLSPRLVELIGRHPAIKWHPDFIPQAEYEDMLATSDIFVSPAVGTFRNGLIQAMLHGLVPVISDCHYAAEFVEHEVRGLIVDGRRCLADIPAGSAGFRSDWRALYSAVDQPANPPFFIRLKDALRRLVTDRALLRRMSGCNLTEGSRHELSPMDVEKFRTLIGEALRAAE